MKLLPQIALTIHYRIDLTTLCTFNIFFLSFCVQYSCPIREVALVTITFS